MARDPVIDVLCDLVAIDSVNPSLVSGARGEGAIAAYLADLLRQAGLTVTVQEALTGRPNVVGVLEGRRPGPTLMFCGHTDTVGVAGMEHPFTPQISGDRLYGRGSQDMKSGVSAMVDAARTLAGDGGLGAGRLIVAAVIDEEHGSAGADALVRGWHADAAVITEPTGLDIGIAHKGFQWVTVRTLGRAAHGSRPADGRDAIMFMGRVLSAFESLSRDLDRGRVHPLLGRASLHASIINGGTELSTYPGSCSLQLERRTLPGEPDDAAIREAERILVRLSQEDPEFVGSAEGTFGRRAYELPDDHPLASTLRAAATDAGVGAQQIGLSFWTDAAILGAAGIPAVLFGPGGAGLHSTEEYVLIPDVCACRDTLVTLGRRFTGGDERDNA